jgi:hypothetical protein
MLKTSITIATILLITLPVTAETINWNKYRASYVSINTDNDIYEPVGFSLSQTRMFNEDVFGSIDFTFVTDNALIEGVETTTDTTYFDAAIGIKHTLKETTDIYTSIAIESYQNDFIAEYNDQSNDNIGYSVSLGVRSLFYNSFELHANTTRIIYDGDGRWDYMLGAAFNVNTNFAIELSYVKGKYSDKVLIGCAFGF